MNVIALDLATLAGFAIKNDAGRISSGTVKFELNKDESPGVRFLRCRGWLEEKTQEVGQFGLVVYEQAHHRGGDATRLCVGLVTVALQFAAFYGAESLPVPTRTLKKWATGNGNADKKAMIAEAVRMGFSPRDDNEADALLLLHYAMEKLKGAI